MRPLSEFDPAWPHGHMTRDGRRARVLGKISHRRDELAVAIWRKLEGEEVFSSFDSYGRFLPHGSNPGLDLVNAPAPKKRAKGWVNIYYIGYKFTTADLYDTPEQAREALAQREPFACIYIDVEEGEGLS